ncbi:MAG TPA: 3',5'-cyclic-nucleotide phosphodiesterase [Methylobacterium sp.]
MQKIILALSLVAVTAAPSFAASGSKRGNADLEQYCAGDAISFCAGIPPDDPAMDACFKKNRTKLSENCQRAISAYEKSGGK